MVIAVSSTLSRFAMPFSRWFKNRDFWRLLDEAAFQRADRSIMDTGDDGSFHGTGRALSRYSGRDIRRGVAGRLRLMRYVPVSKRSTSIKYSFKIAQRLLQTFTL